MWTGLQRGRSSSPGRAKTGSDAHTDSYQVSIGVLSKDVRRPGREADLDPPHSTARSTQHESEHPFPHALSWRSASLGKNRDKFAFY
jgi:hypothetical protein